MDFLPGPEKLLFAIHYSQKPGDQPRSYQIADNLEMVELLTSGRGWLSDDGKRVEATAGTLLWHAPGDETIAESDVENPYRCLSVLMESGLCAGTRRVPRVSYWHDLGELQTFVQEIVTRYRDEAFDKSALLDYLFSRLRFEAMLCHHRREQTEIPEPLRKARDLLERDFAKPGLRVRGLARAAGWSLPHLHDQFMRIFGESPRQLILRRRMKLARDQLVGTGYSIKQIAAETGFTHSAAFCASFRKAEGVSPKAYRERYGAEAG